MDAIPVIIVLGIAVFVIIMLLRSVTAFRGGVAETKAPAILDRAFDGRRDVSFKVGRGTIAYETVVIGAKKRGYRLVSETLDSRDGSAKTLIFEKS